jgi:alkanesulfonate monooxygenase SsuD/methylene tetrahydromethanopterin reductase-like flavin-dependent oxidoreductase (luciferase family)
MNIDLILDTRASADDLAEQATLAEDLGFTGIWVSSLMDGRDPFTNLSVAARATSRIALGPIAVNPYDMHPVRISSALYTLNELAGGRARIVLGGGGEAMEALGIQAHRRVRALREAIELVQQTASGERFDYNGEIFTAKGYGLRWLTAPAPKVFVGANMDQMLRMSGRNAEGVMLSDMPPVLARPAIDQSKASAREHGRDPEFMWFGNFMAWHVYPDLQKAQAEARRWLMVRGLFRPWVLETFLEPDEVAEVMDHQQAFIDAFIHQDDNIAGVDPAVTEKLVEHLTLTAASDNLDHVISHLDEYRDTGLTTLCIRVYEEPKVAMQEIASKIMPHFCRN